MFLRIFPRLMALAACILCLGSLARSDDQIDWNRAKQLHERVRPGREAHGRGAGLP